MAQNDELVTILGVELSPETMANIQRFQSGVDSVVSKLKTFSLVATGLAVAAGLVIKGAVDDAAALQTLSDKTGVSTDSLQEWAYAANQVGVDAKAVQSDLVGLTKSMSSPIPGQFNMTFAMLGVSARDASGKLKDSGALIEDLGGKLEGMSTQRAMQWGQKIGISDDTVLLLRQGREGIAKLRAEAHTLGAIIPSEAIKRATQFKAEISSFQATMKSLSSQLAIATIPALSRMIDLFKGWVQASRNWLALHTESFMTGLVTAFERVWGAVKKVVAVFQPLIDKFRDLTSWMDTTDGYTHLITGAMVLLGIAFAPVLLAVGKAIGLFLALSLVAEDVFGYLNGEDSVTGAILDMLAEKFPGITKLFKTLKDLAISLFQGAIQPGLDIVKQLGTLFLETLGNVGASIDEVAERAANFIDTFSSKYPALIEVIKFLAGIIGEGLGGAIKLVAGMIENFFALASKVFGWLFDAIELGMKGLNKLAEWSGFGEEAKPEGANSVGAPEGAQKASPAPRGGIAYGAGGFGLGLSRATPKASESKGADEEGHTFTSRSPRPDATKFAPAPTSSPSSGFGLGLQSSSVRGENMIERPQVAASSGPVITDNRTVNQHISTSDPVLAGNTAAERAGGGYGQLMNPGLNAPVVR